MSSGNIALIALAAVALYALATPDSRVASGATGGTASGTASGATGGQTGGSQLSDAERWIRLGIETLRTIDDLFFD